MKLYKKRLFIISTIVISFLFGLSLESLNLKLGSNQFNDDSDDLKQTKEQIEDNLKKINKVLFMVKLPENLNSPNQLNFVNYKNMVVSNNQVSFFISDRNNVAERDTTPIITSYIYTINTADINLPCMNRSYVCLYQEFLGEYLKLFPEINYAVPKEIVQFFGDRNKMMDKCIVLTDGPAINLEFANWICHPDSKYIKTIQDLLSTKVRATTKDESMDLFVRMAYQGSTADGILRLESDKVKFVNLQKAILYEKKFIQLNLAAVSLYLKEDLPADLKGVIDDGSRCFKITELSPELNRYFCVLYSKTDQAMQRILTIVESRWYALFYSDDFTRKSTKVQASYSLSIISKSSSSSLEIDHSLLIAIKNQVRNEYLIGRHQIMEKYKANEMSKTQTMSMLRALKQKTIDAACNGIEVCKKALIYCADKGLLPLSGNKEKFAMDAQNPYANKLPSQRLAVSSVVSGKGMSMVSQAAAKKGSAEYWAQHLPAASKGETPNFTNIKQAMNTFASIKANTNTKFSDINDFGNYCRQSVKTNSNNIKRKVALLNLVPKIDPYLQYLGYVHDKTLGKVN
jgi:hypothetical protein